MLSAGIWSWSEFTLVLNSEFLSLTDLANWPETVNEGGMEEMTTKGLSGTESYGWLPGD